MPPSLETFSLRVDMKLLSSDSGRNAWKTGSPWTALRARAEDRCLVPPFDFLDKAFVRVLRRMGHREDIWQFTIP